MNTEPIHPGTLIQPLILDGAGLSQSLLARQLGFNQPQPVNELVKGKRAIPPQMALLLERLTEAQYPAEFWLLAQLRWDIYQARQSLPAARLALVQHLDSLRNDSAVSEEAQAELLAMSANLRDLSAA
jgi:addiction module HigA family antidote